MAELEAIGVRGSGVRLQRFEDGSMVRDIPGLFKIAFIFDRIEKPVADSNGDRPLSNDYRLTAGLGVDF